MIIQNIKINNFRNIKNIFIDFTSNGSGSETDILKGNFVKCKKGKVLPQVSTLIGPNAIGKTSIIDAITFLNYVSAGQINMRAAMDILVEESVDQANISRDALKGEARKFIKLMGEKKVPLESVNNFLRKKWEGVKKIHASEASDSSKPIDISATFWNYDLSKEEKVSIKLGEEVLNIESTEDFKKEEAWAFKHNEASFYLGEALPEGVIKFNSNDLKNFFDYLGVEKLLKLINIADPSISAVFKEGDKFLFKSVDSEFDISFDSLSSGTKRYLHTAYFIIQETKRRSGVFIIDEIELNLHRELALSLIQAMDLITENNKNISFIFTTHNPMLLGENVNYKQVLEISKDVLENKHKAQKLSTLFKAHENIESKYKKGIISKFPSNSYSFDNMFEVINE